MKIIATSDTEILEYVIENVITDIKHHEFDGIELERDERDRLKILLSFFDTSSNYGESQEIDKEVEKITSSIMNIFETLKVPFGIFEINKYAYGNYHVVISTVTELLDKELEEAYHETSSLESHLHYYSDRAKKNKLRNTHLTHSKLRDLEKLSSSILGKLWRFLN